MDGQFEIWWTNQCLKMASGEKPYFAKSIYPGDQKCAFNAGVAASVEEVIRLIAEQKLCHDDEFLLLSAIRRKFKV